jgi:hypothetical protein
MSYIIERKDKQKIKYNDTIGTFLSPPLTSSSRLHIYPNRFRCILCQEQYGVSGGHLPHLYNATFLKGRYI